MAERPGVGRVGVGAGRVMWSITYIPALYKALYLFACCWLVVEGVRESEPVSGLSARRPPRSEAGPRACTGAQAVLGILTCP